MDRRTLLKRLGLAGLAIPVAMAVETKLLLPEAERKAAAKAISRGVFEVDGQVVREASVTLERGIDRFYEYDSPYRTWVSDSTTTEPPVYRRATTKARWVMATPLKFELGDAVRLSLPTAIPQPLIVYVTGIYLREFGWAECEGEGVYA